MNSFQKHLKDNIKKFDAYGFLNYLKFLNIKNFSDIKFIPNSSLISSSSYFENIEFRNKIIVTINHPLPNALKLYLNNQKLENKDSFNQTEKIISEFYHTIFSKLHDFKIYQQTDYQLSYNQCFIRYCIKKIFYEYNVNVFEKDSNKKTKKKFFLKLGDKLNIIQEKKVYIVKIYSDKVYSEMQLDLVNDVNFQLIQKFIDIEFIFLPINPCLNKLFSLPYKLHNNSINS